MFKKWFLRFKYWGLGSAIDALDNFKTPLGTKIQADLDQIHELSGYGLACWLIEEVKSWLRIYFKLPVVDATPPKKI